jgi:hypothetical protein
MKPTYVQRFVALFRDHPYQPFDGIKLARICPYAWRTRVSDARGILARRGRLKNTQTRLKDGSKRSTYTFLPN